MLVVDQAGYHIADEVTVPAGIRREFLPSYSLALQPAERLWPLTNDVVANPHFADIITLDDQVAVCCRTLSAQPEAVCSHARSHWWPTEEAA